MNKDQNAPRGLFSLTAKAVAVLSLLLLAANLLLGGVLVYQSRDTMRSLLEQRMLDVSNTAAAMLDGATDGQVNRYVVLPYIKPILRISVIFAITGSLKSFDLIYVLTNGGPLHATEVPSTLMIKMLFERNRYGMGSAIAVLLILLCFGFALLINRVFKEEK